MQLPTLTATGVVVASVCTLEIMFVPVSVNVFDFEPVTETPLLEAASATLKVISFAIY